MRRVANGASSSRIPADWITKRRWRSRCRGCFAVGYHQPPVYHMPTFQLKDDWGTHVETGGRFRLKDKAFDEVGVWRWEENPFVGTRPYQGLLVMLMMFNSTDLKNSNNSLYEYKRAGRVERRYAVRDIGAALGDTNPLAPRKNHPDSFEKYPFILGINNRHVQFAYTGWERTSCATGLRRRTSSGRATSSAGSLTGNGKTRFVRAGTNCNGRPVHS